MIMMMMEWEKQQQQLPAALPQQIQEDGKSGGVFVKVMTDEQMEVLRKQIAAYGTICEQLVELHKSLSSHHDFAGVRLANLYCDPLVTSGGQKIAGRQRWTPTPMQLQILENIFDQGTGNPSKQKITEITSELSQHGQISETNVYNWFQNRRARSKRKQQISVPNNAESVVKIEVDSPSNKKTKTDDNNSMHNQTPTAQDLHFQNPGTSSGMQSIDPRSNKMEPLFSSENGTKPAGNINQMTFYGSMLSNPRMDHFIGKMEVPGSYNPYLQPEDYHTTG